MIDINVIASNSSGNAIAVSDGRSTILLDAGLPYSKLSRAVKLSEVEAVLITHEHGDHSKGAEELIRRGVKVCLSLGTAEALKFGGTLYTLVQHLEQIETQNWKILPFNVKHDAAEPLGFLCQSKNTGGKIVYIVDSAYVNYAFNGVTHWLIEANFDENGLEKSSYHPALKKRIRRNHFSFENLLRFFGSSDLSKTEEIWLLHMSDANSNEKKFIEQIQKTTGVPTYAG